MAAEAGPEAEFLISVLDYEGVVVTCTADRWRNKVEANHPELIGAHDAVAEVIGHPEIVFEDRDYRNRKHHIRQHPNGLYMDAIAEYRYDPSNGAEVGRLVTAFLRTNLRDGDLILYLGVRR